MTTLALLMALQVQLDTILAVPATLGVGGMLLSIFWRLWRVQYKDVIQGQSDRIAALEVSLERSEKALADFREDWNKRERDLNTKLLSQELRIATLEALLRIHNIEVPPVQRLSDGFS